MKTLNLTDDLYQYVLRHTPRPHPLLDELARETARLPRAQMQVAAEQGAFMHLLAKLLGAKNVLEVGCFTGYSALAVATALPKDGRLITLDVDPEATGIAKRYFAAAGLGDRINLRLAPALDTLPSLEREFGRGFFDMMFIDADKKNIQAYFDWGTKVVRSGGLILVDNTLWSGAVVDPADQSPDTVAIRTFNAGVIHDSRVESVLLNIADGLTLARVRGA